MPGLGRRLVLPESARQLCEVQVAACLSLPSVVLALQRIAVRVRQGGHDAPRVDVVRRFRRSLTNFQMLYRDLADTWYLYDNSEPVPRLQEEGP